MILLDRDLSRHAPSSREEDAVCEARDDVSNCLEVTAADGQQLTDASNHLAAVVAPDDLDIRIFLNQSVLDHQLQPAARDRETRAPEALAARAEALAVALAA